MRKSYGAISISAVYLLFGMLWIFFSDALLEKISPDLEVYAKFQTYKGWLYNEILSNAFTHAFPDGRGGRIEVRFSSEGGGNSLIIEDNGIGFDQDKTGSNLGLDLIDMLSEQLGGDLKITSEPGRTKFSLSFR